MSTDSFRSSAGGLESSASLSTGPWDSRITSSVLEPLQLADGFPPSMFDQLSFSPERDAPQLIRKNPLTNLTVAVSVPRLMALLTQHDVLDYSQMLDFFFCYRSYVTPGDLLNYLLARFSWALHRRIANPGSEIGRDVAVRTFVVLRHWILNFFPDDFVPRFQLRSQFCIGINKLYNWFRQNAAPGSTESALGNNHSFASDIAIARIFEQLKKGWTRSSAMYWPGESTIDEANVLALPLSPGGVFGGLMNIQKSNAPENRRSTLLAFYKDSASPILSSPPPSKEVLPLLNGTIIGGGIPLNDSVTKNPSEHCDLTTEEINCIPKTPDIYQQFYLESPVHGPIKKRSFLHKVLHKITKSNSLSTISDPPVKSQSVSSDLSTATVKPLNIPDDGIDLLSQQVLDELAVLLKEKTQSEKVASVCSDYCLDTEGHTGRASFVDSLCIQKHFARSREMLSYYQSSERENSLDDQSSLNGVNIDRITKDLEIEMPFVSNDSQESSAQISIVSENRSTDENQGQLPGSVYQSAESILSLVSKSSVEEPHSIVRGLRRQVHLQNIHDAVKTNSNLTSSIIEAPSGLAEPRFSMITVDSIGTSIDTGSSSLSLSDGGASMISAFESEEDHLQRDPYPPGVDAEIAAELAAIPDDTPDDDAVRAALEKLEGVYLKQSKAERQKEPGLSALRDSRFVNLYSESNLALVTHESNYFGNKTESINIPVSDSYKSFASMHLVTSTSHNSNLYNAAFQSRFNIASLTRHDSMASRHMSGSTMGSDDASSADLGEYEDASESIGEVEATGTPRVMSAVPMNSPPTLKADDRRSFTSELESVNLVSDFLDSGSAGSAADTNNSPKKEDILSNAEEQKATDPESSFFERSAGKTHVPFVLYYNTNLICDQLALIERDALAEVDWNELVELKWSKKLQPVRSWLSMLLERKYTGADLAISRFNLVVNWVKSEIVLTKDMELRAATIAKFIRMAQRARDMQNYATMMQLVLGLSSDLIQNRISEATWAKVSTGDMLTLKELINLISPMKNFQKLRNEISQLDPDQGCTPFIGIYLSDLTSNEERPAYLDQANTIINLDKLRTTATIVRSLMQCIEWSSNNGQYKLDYDLLAKCLYIHSLTVEEMDQCVREINSM